MIEALEQLFGAVCSQNPEHTWAPGGILLPCCQRCTGLYAGACVAALLHVWLRPRLGARFLEAHGLFLLLMAPFGFHWVAQGPVLRAITGVLFGFGAATFLWLPWSAKLGQREPAAFGVAAGAGRRPWLRNRTCLYAVALLATLALLPLAATRGGKGAAYVLAVMTFAGAMLLAALVLGDIGIWLSGALRLARRLASPRSGA